MKRRNYATDGTVQPQVFMEDAKGNQYDISGNIIPPAQDPVNSALSVARRETDPYLMVPGHEHLTRVPPVSQPRPEYVPGEAISAATQPSRDVFWQGVEQFRNPQTEPKTPERAWELLSGAGLLGLGALGTGVSGVIGGGVELLPTWLTGNQNQRNKLASELNEMAMFADPVLGPEALAATTPVQRVGGIRNAAAIEGDLAKGRMAERGPSALYDPLRVSSGVDPTEAGKALANAADTAIAKVGEALDPALKASQNATGGDDIAAATRTAQLEALNPVEPPQGITPPANALQTERSARTVIAPTSIKLTPQEQAVVNSFKSRADRAIVASRIRETKARYPKSDGWAPFEAVGAEFDDKGNPVIKWKEQTYGFNTAVQPGNRTVTDPVTGEKNTIQVNEPRGLRPGTAQYEAQARKATRNGVKEVEDIIRRAGEGDENALRIIRQAGWYREFMRKGFDERGGSYPAFSDLLGATSPNTAVDQNYRYSVDLQNRFARGDFDEQTAFARDYQGSLNEFPEEKLIYRDPVGPKGPQKLQYGMNSRNAQMALADKWRTKEPGQAPKARNFSGNLGGATDQATIDVWAARFINRMAGRKRLPPPVESGVKGKLGSNLEPTGEFGFGQDVFRRITDELNRKGNLLPYLQELGYDRLTPMDMQALTWFIEKERWTKNNWTTAAGEGGSFEDELLNYPSERWQSGVSIQQADPPSDVAMATTRNVFENSLRDDPNVNQYRVHPTIGRYAGNNERSFDLELTAKPGWNPRTWMAAVIREAKANNQYDVFFSKRLSPEAAQTNPNARPGVEIYFRDRKTLDDALPILEEFTKRNADGFTFVTDLRLRERELGGKEAPDFVGVRMQWVPEIRSRWDEDFRNAVAADPGVLDIEKIAALNSMQNAIDALDKAGLGIVDARVHHYDTLTIGKESYDKFLDGITDPQNAAGNYEGSAGAAVDPVKRFGQPIYSHVEGRNRALRAGSEGGQSDASGAVGGAGQSAGALTPEQRSANFQSAFSQTYLKDPQGNPMRLYHLTPSDITEFSASSSNRAGPVVYLSPYPEFQPAHHQAGIMGERGEFTGGFREGANVMPVYADVRNPLVLDHPRKIREAAAKYQNGDREFPRYISPEAKAAMEADGYDSIIFGGENPIPYGDRPFDARLGHQEARDEEFIIFDPKKIKSAIGNEGTYDFTTGDITKAFGGALVDDEDIDNALRLARATGGRAGYATDGSVAPQVMMEDAKGNKYDAQGNVIPPTAPTGPNPQRDDSAFTNTAPENYKTDVQPFIDYAVTPIDRPGMPSEPDLVDVMRVAAQVAAQGQPTDDRGARNLARRRTEAVREFVGASPEGYQSDYKGPFTYNAGDTANFLNTLIDFSPYGALEYMHDIPYEAGRTGDYGNAAVEGGLGALMTAPGMTIAGRGLKKGYEAVKSSPKMAAGIAGVAGLTASSDEAEAGPARWFSKAMEVAGALPMEKMTGEQALAMLRKGVSPEELKWTGADTFLPQQKQITKQDLVDYLAKNRVQMNEVVLGGNKPTNIYDVVPSDQIKAKYQPKIDEVNQKLNSLSDIRQATIDRDLPSYDENYMSDYMFRKERDALLDELSSIQDQIRNDAVAEMGGLAAPTKYQDYSTAGGEGYTETLYQFGRQKAKPSVVEKDGMWEVVDESGEVMRSPDGKAYSYWSQNDAERAARSLYRESGSYQSPHWNDPDVIAHTRSNTLTYEPPGSNRPYKVHNVEETQSDLAQQGRKTGFRAPDINKRLEQLDLERNRLNSQHAKARKEIESEFKEATKSISDEYNNRVRQIELAHSRGETNRRQYEEQLGDAMTWYGDAVKPYREKTSARYMAEVVPLEAQEDKLMREVLKLHSSKNLPPLMPYVSSTEGWTDFAIKKELDKALDSDADYFSWSPGEVHAERYDLSKHIGKVQYNPDDGSLLAYNPQGKMVVNESVNDPSDLDEYLGKELADKMRAEADSRSSSIDEYEIAKDEETGEWTAYLYGEPIGETFPSKGHVKDYLKEMMANEFASNPVELAGLDLKVGGEGMLGYYNKIYLKRVQEVIKKATGIKPQIETITVDTADGPRQQLGIRITDEMREKARFSDFARGGAVNKALALTADL